MMVKNETLVGRIDMLLTDPILEKKLVQEPFEAEEIDTTLPEYLQVPTPITEQVESLGNDYFMELEERTDIMLALQVEQMRLLKAENSDFYNKMMKHRNYFREKLSKKPITERNIFEAQIDNLSGLKDTLYQVIKYSRYLLDSFECYQDQIAVELHYNKKYLQAVSGKIPSVDSMAKWVNSRFSDMDFMDDEYIPTYVRRRKLDRVNRRMHHSKLLVCDSIEYLAGELPLLEKLGVMFESSTDNSEGIVRAIEKYERSLIQTKDMVFTEIQRGRNISVVASQLENLAKMAANIYRKVGLSVQKANDMKKNTNAEYMFGRNLGILEEHSKDLELAENIKSQIINDIKKY